VGYDLAGNVTSASDINSSGGSVMGTWTYAYDTLNRLVSGHNTATTPASIQYANMYGCWAYDSFGNRTANDPLWATACPAQESSLTPTDTYNTNNQMDPSTKSYDPSGNMTADSSTGNTYLYDGEGRICAVSSTPVPGFTTMTGYVYDAEGNRVAKGTITSMSCDPSVNGLMTANNETDYVLGPGGEQVTELAQDANGTMNWQRTYVYAGGALIATYNPNPDNPSQPLPSFRLTDWLGTMRATTDAYGVAQGTCTGLPYGDGVTCSGDIPDNHHFTGKERDAESGNDYFGARYYASSMGRWMSPDKPFADQHTSNPQSWNLYEYGRNNPLKNVDLNGFKVLQAVLAEAVSKINSLQGGTLYIDFAGIQGLHPRPSLNASNNFDRWHSDHHDANSVIVPNNGIVSGFLRALFGLPNKDQVDTGKAIVAAAKASGQDIAFDTYSNGVNAAGKVAQGMSPGDLQSATVVGPNANSPAPVQEMDQADLGNTLIVVSSNDPALALALFGSQSVSDWASEFPGEVIDPGQASHNLNAYQSAITGKTDAQETADRLCAMGNPAACN
jgi:RHS repeat-associated protein